MDLDRQTILGLFDVRFDIIVLADVLDLVLDPEGLMKQIKDILTNSGVVCVSVTNDNTIYHRLRVLLGKGINKNPFNKYYHIRHPTLSQSKEFLAGYFQIKKCKYWICFDDEQPVIFDKIALFLANLFPNLFARGAVFLCENKEKIK